MVLSLKGYWALGSCWSAKSLGLKSREVRNFKVDRERNDRNDRRLAEKTGGNSWKTGTKQEWRLQMPGGHTHTCAGARKIMENHRWILRWNYQSKKRDGFLRATETKATGQLGTNAAFNHLHKAHWDGSKTVLHLNFILVYGDWQCSSNSIYCSVVLSRALKSATTTARMPPPWSGFSV